jgi:hypothetical protein
MLVTVIHHCPNLELFTVEWPITSSFPVIADSLVTYSAKSLASHISLILNSLQQLTFLDLNMIPVLDLLRILAACPMLTNFSFNPDWRLPFHADQIDNAAATLLRKPHSHITHLGLHQLHAFLPHPIARLTTRLEVSPYRAALSGNDVQRTDDLTFWQLTRALFPALKVQ